MSSVANNPTASEMGRKGGQNGTGKAKTRSREHYQKAAKARWAKHKLGGRPRKDKKK